MSIYSRVLSCSTRRSLLSRPSGRLRGTSTLKSLVASYRDPHARPYGGTAPLPARVAAASAYVLENAVVEGVAVEGVDVDEDVYSLETEATAAPFSWNLGQSVARTNGINMGYTCDNITLKRERNMYTSRSCIKKTFETKGLGHVSELALANALDLLELIKWNHERGIHLYRMTSKLFPWAGHYELEDLPDFPTIKDALSAAGELARAAEQRITNHPSCYIKLAATNDDLIQQSVRDLEVQSRIFDLMGYEPSHENKINIHVGGVYGNKRKAMERFARTFGELSAGLKARLTVENDDSANSYAVDDLLVLHDMTGIPITFDFHHYQFCPGEMSKKEAFEAAIGTWPQGIRPVVHWSELPECPNRRKSHPHSHSNFVYGPLDLFGYEQHVDVMIESKAKEAALLLLRERL